ncbi:hypothetical protein PCE1_001374 [Barthelona sp. PCE]
MDFDDFDFDDDFETFEPVVSTNSKNTNEAPKKSTTLDDDLLDDLVSGFITENSHSQQSKPIAEKVVRSKPNSASEKRTTITLKPSASGGSLNNNNNSMKPSPPVMNVEERRSSVMHAISPEPSVLITNSLKSSEPQKRKYDLDFSDDDPVPARDKIYDSRRSRTTKERSRPSSKPVNRRLKSERQKSRRNSSRTSRTRSSRPPVSIKDAEMRNVLKQLKIYQKENESLHNKLDSYSFSIERINDYETIIKEKDKEISELVTETKTLKRIMRQQEKELLKPKRGSVETTQAMEQIRVMQEERRKMTRECASMRNTINAYRQKIEQQELSISRLSKGDGKKAAELVKHIKHLNDKINHMDKQLDKEQKRVEIVQNARLSGERNLEREISHYKSLAEDLEKELETARQQIMHYRGPKTDNHKDLIRSPSKIRMETSRSTKRNENSKSPKRSPSKRKMHKPIREPVRTSTNTKVTVDSEEEEEIMPIVEKEVSPQKVVPPQIVEMPKPKEPENDYLISGNKNNMDTLDLLDDLVGGGDPDPITPPVVAAEPVTKPKKKDFSLTDLDDLDLDDLDFGGFESKKPAKPDVVPVKKQLNEGLDDILASGKPNKQTENFDPLDDLLSTDNGKGKKSSDPFDLEDMLDDLL